jgi:twitching motility protein PilT
MSEIIDRFKTLVKRAKIEEASDIHLCVGHEPIFRITGQLLPLPDEKKLSAEDLEILVQFLAGEERYQMFLKNKDIDLSFQLGETRLRINAYFQRGTISLAARLISQGIRSIEELNLPLILKEFAHHAQGFVLITGSSSQGKSTTLAALIEEINRQQKKMIITLEDPIEYLFQDKQSVISQREIYADAMNFPRALRSTLREDPDIIVVGEMRDLETISTAVIAAETGHLVFATLHTNSASESIHRLVDVFPAIQQNQIRMQLASSLLGIVSQRLIPSVEGKFIPACEVLIATHAIANLIRRNDVDQMPLVIQTSSNVGMISMNQSLTQLVRSGKITTQKALAYSLSPNELRQFLRA